MKEQIAKLKYLHIAPRKVRLVANSLKGLSVNEAEAQLLISPKRAAAPIIKILRSAIANAKHNKQIDPARLFIKEIRVDQGPMLKRLMPRASGRANLIQKKSSHIILVLGESEKLKAPRFKIKKPERVSEKVKAEREKIKRETEKPKVSKPETAKPTEKPGFIKKIFRRKTV